MSLSLSGLAAALWLGILTSISPCPLATNVAAISYLGNRLGRSRQVLFAGLLYTLGRILTYLALGALIVAGLLKVPGLSNFLQKYMNQILGPVLILAGMFLLDWISLPVPSWGPGEKVQGQMERAGVWGAGLLGIVFALSFCPVSAALFFGSLIPLALKHQSPGLMPALYGLGTGLPVVAFAIALAFSARSVGRIFDRLALVERWARRLTGGIFILVGIYYCLTYIFQVNF
ncbi:MAG: cytochrome C biogenesis protein [Deltaproteobacteria bacterium RBG_13_61_14]|nr:MAG: cytochrome C biogenesis protein [Deltaproteobacteria bacterium RBG_13_61_14]